MKDILAGFAIVVLLLALAGSFGIGEFRLCYGPTGYCTGK